MKHFCRECHRRFCISGSACKADAYYSDTCDWCGTAIACYGYNFREVPGPMQIRVNGIVVITL